MSFVVFAATILLSGPIALAESGSSATVRTDDICAERPDLCGGGSEARRPAARGCRKKGASYNLDEASLPICPERKIAKKKKKKKVKDKNEDSFDSLLDQVASDTTAEEPRREPAGRASRRISFTSYLNANANHPSIAGRFSGRQEAFVIPTRPSTFSAPGSESVPVGDGSADGQSMKDYPAAPPASGSSASNNQNH